MKKFENLNIEKLLLLIHSKLVVECNWKRTVCQMQENLGLFWKKNWFFWNRQSWKFRCKLITIKRFFKNAFRLNWGFAKNHIFFNFEAWKKLSSNNTFNLRRRIFHNVGAHEISRFQLGLLLRNTRGTRQGKASNMHTKPIKQTFFIWDKIIAETISPHKATHDAR